MKNIIWISIALLIFGGCSNPVADDDSTPSTECTCTVDCGCEGDCGCSDGDCTCAAGTCAGGTCSIGGCSADGCGADCSCGCDGLGGDNCSCSDGCACSTTCAGGACSADGCGVDCPCGCGDGEECNCGDDCTCFDDTGDDGTTHNIWYSNNSSPTSSVGDTVIWTNAGGTHTVTSDDGNFTSSGTLSTGVTYEYTFATAGVFPYHCNFHSSMVGTITVTE